MIILTTNSFVGFQFAVQNTDQSTRKLLQYAITRWEAWYINQILGLNVSTQYPTSLAASFIADCTSGNGTPTIATNLKIFNPLAWQQGGRIWQSKGMPDILASLVYYQWIMLKMASDSQSGVDSPNVDAANILTLRDAGRFAATRFNDALVSIEAIWKFLKAGNGVGGAGNGGPTDYPSFIQPRHDNELKFKYFV